MKFILPRFLNQGARAASFFLVSLGLIFFLSTATYYLVNPYGHNTEGVTATAVFDIPVRPLIYKDFAQGPMTRFPYTPLYAYLVFPVSLLTARTFLCGRIVSMVFFLFSLWVLYRLLRIHGTDRGLSRIIALMVGAFGPTYAYAFAPDLTAFCFNLLGIYFFIRWDRKPKLRRTRYFALALLCFTLAFFTKQSYVTGIAALVLFLAFRARWKTALIFMAAQSLLILIPSILLDYATNGAYYKNTVLANVVEYSTRLFFLSLTKYTYPHRAWLFFVIALVSVIWRFARRRAGLFDFYFLMALASLWAIGANGSGDNYFIEIVTASAAQFGIFLAGMIRWADRGAGVRLRERRTLATGLVWAVFLLQLMVFYRNGTFGHNFKSPIATLIKQAEPISKIIRQTAGDILSEDLGILIASGKPVVYEPFEYTQLVRRGLWNEERILERLKRREFSLIVLNTDFFRSSPGLTQTSRFSEKFVQCLHANYKFYGFFNGYYMLVRLNWSAFVGGFFPDWALRSAAGK